MPQLLRTKPPDLFHSVVEGNVKLNLGLNRSGYTTYEVRGGMNSAMNSAMNRKYTMNEIKSAQKTAKNGDTFLVENLNWASIKYI